MFLVLLAIFINVPDSTFADGSARACFDRLHALSGFGRLAQERAAFLVYRDDGTFDCVVWPASHRHHAEEWRGAIPDGTAAIAHTHPNDRPDPSHNDMAVAQRLGIPVFVVTRFGVARTVR